MTDRDRITIAIENLYAVVGNAEKTRQANTYVLMAGVLDERLRVLNGMIGRLECIREDMRAE